MGPANALIAPDRLVAGSELCRTGKSLVKSYVQLVGYLGIQLETGESVFPTRRTRCRNVLQGIVAKGMHIEDRNEEQEDLV